MEICLKWNKVLYLHKFPVENIYNNKLLKNNNN